MNFIENHRKFPSHVCTGGCDGCDCFIEKMRSTPEGKEMLFSRFRSLGKAEIGKERVCIKSNQLPVTICDASPNGEDGVEIGYMTDPEFQGKGLATKAVKRMIGYLGKKGVRQIYAYVEQNNPHAASVIAKCGGVPEIQDMIEHRNSREEIKWVIYTGK